jgi:Tfp pilus assembly protein PilV
MKRRKSGFLLAEVLVAVTIMVAGVSVLLMAIVNCVHMNRDTRDRSMAIFLAQRVMWDMEERTHLSEDGEVASRDNGDFQLDKFRRFRWESEIEDSEKTASYEIKVTVFWKARLRDTDERIFILYSSSLMPRDSIEGD